MSSKKTKKTEKVEVEVDDKKMQEEFEEIKKHLEELRTRLGMTNKSSLTKLPIEAAKKVGDTASDIIKTASDVVEKALKVVQYAALGAVEGGKKALKTEAKQQKKQKEFEAPKK